MSLLKILFFTGFVMFTTAICVAQPVKLMKIAVYLENKKMNELSNLDIQFTDVETDNESFLIGVVNELELPKLEYNNFNYDILIDDMDAYNEEKQKYGVHIDENEFVRNIHLNFSEPKIETNVSLFTQNSNTITKVYSVFDQLIYDSSRNKSDFLAGKIKNGVYVYQNFINKMPQKPHRIVILN